MRRSFPFAVAVSVVLALGVGGYVRASSQAQQQRVWDFQRKANEERKRLGIKDYASATAQYPTPQVKFLSAKPPALCPGQKVTLKATGKIPSGAAAFVLSDAVTVTNEKLTTTSWQADVQVNKDALPESVEVRIVSPVSGSYTSEQPLDIACTYRWSLTLDSGETLTVTTDWTAGGSVRAQGEWSRNGKKLSPVELEVRRDGDGQFSFTRLTTATEAQAQMEGISAAMESPEWKKLDARQEAAMKAFEACQKKPVAEMSKCMKAPSDELKAVGDARNALMTAGRDKGTSAAGLPEKAGCEELQVKAAPGGKLTGEGEKCVTTKTAKLTGTVQAG